MWGTQEMLWPVNTNIQKASERVEQLATPKKDFSTTDSRGRCVNLWFLNIYAYQSLSFFIYNFHSMHKIYRFFRKPGYIKMLELLLIPLPYHLIYHFCYKMWWSLSHVTIKCKHKQFLWRCHFLTFDMPMQSDKVHRVQINAWVLNL